MNRPGGNSHMVMMMPRCPKKNTFHCFEEGGHWMGRGQPKLGLLCGKRVELTFWRLTLFCVCWALLGTSGMTGMTGAGEPLNSALTTGRIVKTVATRHPRTSTSSTSFRRLSPRPEPPRNAVRSATLRNLPKSLGDAVSTSMYFR